MQPSAPEIQDSKRVSFDKFREEVITDYRHACESRQVSLLGRKEVLSGKAKFGIFGDGKEVVQVAVAKSAAALWAADYLMTAGDVKKVLVLSPLSTLDRVKE